MFHQQGSTSQGRLQGIDLLVQQQSFSQVTRLHDFDGDLGTLDTEVSSILVKRKCA